ncbi:IS4 family transposase [Herpetosiphon geysericola]|uniref:IS4 family transposase n=1 Tax=Herpetosiphon geysericola TaxID=70996 RepID=UPI001EECFF37|nr:IS4 family transposase [Herpetosiphon geysericola]
MLAETHCIEQRHRRLTMRTMVWLLIAMNIWTHCAIPTVYRHLTRGLRWIWPSEPLPPIPQSGAFTYRRYQLGVHPLHTLMRRICRPRATPTTPGAFLFGLRLMALDGTIEDVADTPPNAAYFGRPGSRRGPGAFPQAKLLYLIECGTHAIVDAGIWPCRTSEWSIGKRLLRSVGPGMLLLWDCGFHSHALLTAAQDRGAQIIGRIGKHLRPRVQTVLADGSVLVTIFPPNHGRLEKLSGMTVRMISYQLSMPALGDPTTVHRLITTLLDPVQYPARAIIGAYHERWEVELMIDEIDTHQRATQQRFRSQKPVGVIQEFYGLVLAHYAIRAVMHDAGTYGACDPDRISFVLVVQEIQATLREFQQTPTADHERLYQRLLDACSTMRLPKRRFRINPRVVKQKMTKFLRKGPDHAQRNQLRGCFDDAICRVTLTGDPIRDPGRPPPFQWTQCPAP